jgi:FKBP-type peptidyl-prolyl cis-trans isomerase SlyD
VTEVITDPAEKAKAIVEVNFGESEGFKFDFPGDKVSVTLPETTKFQPDWQTARFKIVFDLREAFGVDTVEFIEVWSAAKKDKEE